jgi:antitoxin YefM
MRRLERTDENIAITKNGLPEAALMSMRKFKGLIETLEILSDEKAMKSLRKSIREAQEGKWRSTGEVFGV